MTEDCDQRTCIVCLKTKNVHTAFPFERRLCKACLSEKNRLYKQANSDKNKAYQVAYRAKKREEKK